MAVRSAPAALERAAVAEEVASLIRHDVRNKLAAIRQAASYLSKKTQSTELWATDPRIARFYQLIDSEVTGALEILGDRLAFAPLLAGAPELVDVAGVVEAAIEGLSRVDGDLVGPIAAAELVPGDLLLALDCLLQNALDASDGRVRVSVRDEVTAVTLEISDSGPGMAVADPRPALDGRPGHAGLGLAIARRTVRRMGGKLRLDSGPTGTTATVVLPRRGQGDGQ